MQNITEFGEGLFQLYPHSNAFTDLGRGMVLNFHDGKYKSQLWKMDLASGKKIQLCEFDLTNHSDKQLWADVALKCNKLSVVALNTLWVIDLNHPENIQKIFTPESGIILNSITSIKADGSKVISGFKNGELYGVFESDLATGVTKKLFEKEWWANHFHYSPCNEEWIGFCHEGPCKKIPDRVWAYHPQQMKDGKCIFNQKADHPEAALAAGHERWSFHDTSALVVAYGEGSGTPRGLYECYPDGRETRLISEGNRDWHVNVSQDGKWVVSDTTGADHLPGKGWDNFDGYSDLWIMRRDDGKRTKLTAIWITKSPNFQYYHPHPTFSPDGQWVYFNEANDAGQMRVSRIKNPFFN